MSSLFVVHFKLAVIIWKANAAAADHDLSLALCVCRLRRQYDGRPLLTRVLL